MHKQKVMALAILASSNCLLASDETGKILVSYQNALQFAQRLLSDLYTDEKSYQQQVLKLGLPTADIKHAAAQPFDWKGSLYDLAQLSRKIKQVWYNPRYIPTAQLHVFFQDHPQAKRAEILSSVAPKEGLYDRLLLLKQIEAARAPAPAPAPVHARLRQPTQAASLASFIRINPANNVASADGIADEFQMIIPEGKQLSAKNRFPDSINLLDAVPAIGSYASGARQYRSRLALIELPLKSLRTAPLIVSAYLFEKMLQIPATTISNFLEKGLLRPDIENIKLHIMVTGVASDGSTPAVNNLVFQGWIAALLNNSKFTLSHTDKKAPRFGVFSPDGLVARKGAQSVGIGIAGTADISPAGVNNLQFDMANGRSIVTFWTIGSYQLQDNAALVTYHLILNDATLQALLTSGLQTARTAQDFVAQLEIIAKSGLISGATDQGAFENMIAQVKVLLTSS